MSETMKPRRSTVSCTYPAPRTPSEPYAEVKELAPIPALHLRGRWLAQAGFDIGARIEIIVMAGELVLRVLSSDNCASHAEPGESSDICRGAYL